MPIPSLSSFLETKPLYYKEIDHLRVHRAYTSLKGEIGHPPIIHIIGTNGKGSTGRMIAHLAYQGVSGRGESAAFSVGHFSSPHILKFNERIWLDGRDASDTILEKAHRRLYALLDPGMSEALSYFEYTTLLALVVFEHCDLAVLEAGLGGEYDATNICDKVLSVITPIGIDHQAFLGESIGEIAATKIRSIQRKALLAPQPYPEVLKVAESIAADKGAELYFSSMDSGLEDGEALRDIAADKGWPLFLQENASVAIQALNILNIPYEIRALRSLELFGRFYPLAKNIRIDVGHNPLAAKAIASALKEPVILIYNSLDDKDYEAVLGILKPKIKSVEIMPIHTQRMVTREAIESALRKTGLEYRDFDGAIDPTEHYLVFGSFYTVEAFLRDYRQKTS